MSSIAVAAPVAEETSVAWPRLLWVAPLTLVAALALNFVIRFVVQSIHPSLLRMPQLGPPMVSLTVLGVLSAIVAFIVVGLVTRRPFFWYRVLAVGALLLSWIPDIALAIGGQPAFIAMRFVGPLTSIGMPGPGGRPPGPGGPGGGGGPPPGGGGFTTPIEQVLVLMLLHLAAASVCVVLLTTLTRKHAEARSYTIRSG